MTDVTAGSTLAFLDFLERLTNRSGPTASSEVQTAFEALDEDFSLTEWHKVVNFAGDQFARWQVDWHFSPAAAPNTEAADETEAWDHLWGVFARALVTRVPDVEPLLHRTRNLAGVTRAMQRREQLNRSDLVGRLTSPVLSGLGFVLDRLGFGGGSGWLISRALYPSGTVGRALR